MATSPKSGQIVTPEELHEMTGGESRLPLEGNPGPVDLPTELREFVGGAVDKLPEGINQAVNPIEWLRGMYGLGKFGLQATLQPKTTMEEALAVGKDAAAAFKEHPGRVLGETVGSVGPGLVAGKMMGSAGPGFVKALGKSRAGNIVRAVGAADTAAPVRANIERLALAGRLNDEVPVSLTRSGLGKKIQAAAEALGPEKEAVTSALHGETIPAEQAQSAIRARTPGVNVEVEVPAHEGVPFRADPEGAEFGLGAEGGPPRVETRSVAVDEALRRRMEGMAGRIGRLADPEGNVSAGALDELKQQAQSMAGYDKARSNEFGKRVGSALKETIEGGLPARTPAEVAAGAAPKLGERYKAVNAALEQKLALLKPVEGWEKASIGKRALSKGYGLGRAGAMGAAGYMAGGLPGGVAGTALSHFMNTTLWNTMSAAAKQGIIQAIQAGDMPAVGRMLMAASTNAAATNAASPPSPDEDQQP